MNILQIANEITNLRSQEKERQYGPFEEGMTKAAEIASLITSKEITTEDVYYVMIALKLSRQAYSHKEDNLLDLCAYVGSLNNYLNKESDKEPILPKSKSRPEDVTYGDFWGQTDPKGK
jgi:hypothetical protein